MEARLKKEFMVNKMSYKNRKKLEDNSVTTEPKEVTIVYRHTSFSSDDFVSISMKSQTDSIDSLLAKARKMLPNTPIEEKKTSSMNPMT
jgi:hypothetical protein